MEGTTTFLSFFLLRSFRSNDPPPPPPPLPLSKNSTSTAVLPPSLPPSFPPSLLLAEREEEKGILLPLSFFFLPPLLLPLPVLSFSDSSSLGVERPLSPSPLAPYAPVGAGRMAPEEEERLPVGEKRGKGFFGGREETCLALPSEPRDKGKQFGQNSEGKSLPFGVHFMLF